MDCDEATRRSKLRPLGGREGYETLLNTKHEASEFEQMGRFLTLVRSST